MVMRLTDGYNAKLCFLDGSGFRSSRGESQVGYRNDCHESFRFARLVIKNKERHAGAGLHSLRGDVDGREGSAR